MIGRRPHGLWNVSRLIHEAGSLQATLHHKRRKPALGCSGGRSTTAWYFTAARKISQSWRKLAIRADALRLAFDVLDWTTTLEDRS